MILLLIYLIIMNAVGYIFMGYDKSQAKRKGRRVPEKRLFLIAALGGALGSWLGMRSFRHKTKHWTFVLGIPALLVWNTLFVSYLTIKIL